MKLRQYGALFGITILGIVIHLMPFMFFGSHPLGYDTGFYRRYLIEAGNLFHSVPGLGSEALAPKLFFDIARLLHIPTDVILYGGLIALYTVMTVLLYALVKKFSNKKTALFASLLFVLSPVQYLGYWFMLYKNAFGMVLLLATALLIKRDSKWMYLTAVLLALTHTTTCLIFLFSLVVYFLTERTARQKTTLLFFVAAIPFLLVHSGDSAISLAIKPAADFISWTSFLTYSFPLILLALFGLKSFMKSTRGSFFFSFCFVAIVYPVLHFPFYERIFIFSDIAIVSMAAYGAVNLLTSAYALGKKPTRFVFIGMLALLIVGNTLILSNRISMATPNIDREAVAELESIDETIPENSFILTKVGLAPWVEGWSHSHVMAPGLLYDRHNGTEWTKYFNATDPAEQVTFLKTFPQPLYVFLPSNDQLLFLPSDCTERITDYITKFSCQN